MPIWQPQGDVSRPDELLPRRCIVRALTLVGEGVASEGGVQQSRWNVHDAVQKVQNRKAIRVLVVGARPGEMAVDPQGFFHLRQRRFDGRAAALWT